MSQNNQAVGISAEKRKAERNNAICRYAEGAVNYFLHWLESEERNIESDIFTEQEECEIEWLKTEKGYFMKVRPWSLWLGHKPNWNQIFNTFI